MLLIRIRYCIKSFCTNQLILRQVLHLYRSFSINKTNKIAQKREVFLNYSSLPKALNLLGNNKKNLKTYHIILNNNTRFLLNKIDIQLQKYCQAIVFIRILLIHLSF